MTLSFFIWKPTFHVLSHILYESDAKGNLIPMDQLPALTNSGFSPGMIAVVISEKIQINLTYKSLIQNTPTITNFVQATHSELQTGLETT